MAEAIVGELSDLLWERLLARDPLTALRSGRQVEALPPGGPEAMEQDVSFAASTLGRLAGIDGVDAAFLRDHWRSSRPPNWRPLRTPNGI